MKTVGKIASPYVITSCLNKLYNNCFSPQNMGKLIKLIIEKIRDWINPKETLMYIRINKNIVYCKLCKSNIIDGDKALHYRDFHMKNFEI